MVLRRFFVMVSAVSKLRVATTDAPPVAKATTLMKVTIWLLLWSSEHRTLWSLRPPFLRSAAFRCATKLLGTARSPSHVCFLLPPGRVITQAISKLLRQWDRTMRHRRERTSWTYIKCINIRVQMIGINLIELKETRLADMEGWWELASGHIPDPHHPTLMRVRFQLATRQSSWPSRCAPRVLIPSGRWPGPRSQLSYQRTLMRVDAVFRLYP